MNDDLIRRSALLKDLEYDPAKRALVQPKSTFGIILSAPAVDAVEVIRCRNCGWYNTDSETCGFWPDEGYRDPKHFCGEGKPK